MTPQRDVRIRHTKDLTFSLLTPEDAFELLAFETAERAWFEQHIEARRKQFYTPHGVSQHIVECLALNAHGRMSPQLIRHKGVIIGLANLRDLIRAVLRSAIALLKTPAGRESPKKRFIT